MWSDFETPEAAKKVVKLKAFSKFENTTEALQAAASLVDSKLSKGERRQQQQASFRPFVAHAMRGVRASHTGVHPCRQAAYLAPLVAAMLAAASCMPTHLPPSAPHSLQA